MFHLSQRVHREALLAAASIGHRLRGVTLWQIGTLVWGLQQMMAGKCGRIHSQKAKEKEEGTSV